MRIPILGWEIRATRRPRPDPWDDFWFSKEAQETATGIDITEDEALKYSAVFACVKCISEDIASIPLHIYRREDEIKSPARDHTVYRLLHDAPNPEQTAMQFREALQAHLLLRGNAYAEIIRNQRDQIIELWPLNPDHMTVKRDSRNELYYEYEIDGTIKIFPREDIFHVPGLGFNGLVGYSIISYQREVMGIGLAAQEYQGTNYKNGGRLQLAFIHPAPKAPNPEGRKALREEIRDQYAGLRGQKVGVFWEGMKPEPISMTMEDAQFIESRKFSRTEVCAIFRVPPHKIMDLERATFSNIEESNNDYVGSSLRPWAVRWEQAINQKLLSGSSRFFAEHKFQELLRGNVAARYEAYAVGRQWGWLSRNDIRQLENMNPVPNGDDYLMPSNMTVIGEEPKPAPPADGTQDEVTEDEAKEAARMIKRLRLVAGNNTGLLAATREGK